MHREQIERDDLSAVKGNKERQRGDPASET